MGNDLSDILLERQAIEKSFSVPLRLTRLGPEDMGRHMRELDPLLREMIKSNRNLAMAKERCWERFVDMFRWNN